MQIAQREILNGVGKIFIPFLRGNALILDPRHITRHTFQTLPLVLAKREDIVLSRLFRLAHGEVEFQRDIEVFVAGSSVVAETQDEFVEVVERYVCEAFAFVAAGGERVGRGPGCEGGAEAGSAGEEGGVVAEVLAVFFGELADCAALVGAGGELKVLWCDGGCWWW
jgi:hypothetical protein